MEALKYNEDKINKALNVYVNKLSYSKQLSSKKITYNKFLNNRMLIVHSIRKGIPYTLFNHIKQITPFTESDWASFLNLSTKSLQRYRNDKAYIFKPIHTEKIIELAEVTYLGNTIFDTSEQFYLWLNTPSIALGNLMPIELLKDSYGKEMVINELNRIDQGIFA